MKNISYERFFMNFAHPLRMRIVSELMKGPMSVNEICERVGREQSNVSHHLSGMVKCKILKAERNGKQRIYYLNSNVINPIFKMVESHVDNCCKGECLKCLIGK